METFDFCPHSNVPETLPRDAPSSSMSLGGWQFSARPTTPYQRRFKVTLHGLRWYFEDDDTFDATTDAATNARALELFYQAHETWLPFTFKHQHYGDIVCRFMTPVTVPAGDMNGGGNMKPVEIMLIEHNPGY